MKWLFIIFGIFVLNFFWRGFWAMLIEAISPFKYTAVPLPELKSHFHEFFRRGYSGSQMIVQCENKPVSVKLRKEVSFFRPEFKVRMIAEFDKTLHIDLNKLQKVLKEENLPFGYGPGGFRKNLFGVFVDCDDSVDIAATSAEVILEKCFGLDSESTFEIWVKGMLDWRDLLIDSRDPNSGTVLRMTLTGTIPIGKPYKYSHIPNKYTLGTFLGKAVGTLLHLFRKQ